MAAGEWLQYSLFVFNSSTITFKLRVGSALPGRTFHIEADGVDVTGPVAVPQMPDWDQYETVTLPRINIGPRAGERTVRVVMGPEDFMDFQWMSIE